MERYHKSEDRYQLSMQPVCLDDMAAIGSEVRAPEVIIDHMDIRTSGLTHTETSHTGQKPYAPADMFKIYAYSYFNGIRSSRKIERECGRNIELMRLAAGIRPDFETIADFRKDNKAAITLAFKRFSLLCSELGLTGREMVAADGSKFRACSSRDSCHSKTRITNKLIHHSKAISKYLKLPDECDEQESDTPKLTREEIIKRPEHSEKRIAE